MLTIILRWIFYHWWVGCQIPCFLCLLPAMKHSVWFVGGFWWMHVFFLFFSWSLRFSLWCDTSAKARHPTFESNFVFLSSSHHYVLTVWGILFLLVCTAVHSSFFLFKAGVHACATCDKKKPSWIWILSHKLSECVRAIGSCLVNAATAFWQGV